jgi:MFS transporter, ACS family, D-galactonate transporter
VAVTSSLPSPADTRVSPFRARLILAMLAVFSILNFGDKAVLGLAGPRIVEDLGLTNTQFGTIGSAFYLLFSISALVVGLSGGRLPATWLLAAMALVWSAAQLPILIPAAGYAVLVATRVLLGAGEGPGLPMAHHVAFTWFRPAHRTTAAGVITMGGALGVILGGPVLAATIALAGWRWAFGLLGVLGLLWTSAWLRWGGEGPHVAGAVADVPVSEAPAGLVPNERLDGAQPAGPSAHPGPAHQGRAHEGQAMPGRAHQGQAHERQAHAVRIRRILVNPTWAASAIAGFTGNWVLGLGLSWLPTFLEHRAGFRPTTVGFLLALPSIVALTCLPTVIYIAHRRRTAGRSLHSTYALLGFAAAIVPAVALLGMTLNLPRPALLAAVALAFGAGIPLAPLTASAIADLMPVDRRGVALCMGTAISSLGAVVSPWVTGRLLDLAGTEAAGFDAAFRLASALAMLGAVVLLFLNPERDSRRLVG